MNKINFIEGFHLTPDAMTFLQSSYTEAIGNLAKRDGADFYIISGCEITGGNISNGAVSINGNVMPFLGGKFGAYVRIEENVGFNTNSNGSPERAYFSYVARSSETAEGETVPFSRFHRLICSLAPQPTEWAPLPVTDGFAVINYEYADKEIRHANGAEVAGWRIDEAGNLRLRGIVNRITGGGSSFGANNIFVQLPIKLSRPVKFVAGYVGSTDHTGLSSSISQLVVTVDKNGGLFVSETEGYNRYDIEAANYIKFNDLIVTL